jgi:hypothetical protein
MKGLKSRVIFSQIKTWKIALAVTRMVPDSGTNDTSKLKNVLWLDPTLALNPLVNH